ncbi:hypothetical protein ACHAP5_000559 [Fusarium lateritium]
MGLIGLAIRSLLDGSDRQARSGGCCSRRNQTQQVFVTQTPQLMAERPNYTTYTGRPSCHQRKMERRYQRQMQRAERSQLRAEQQAERDLQKMERRQAGAKLVMSGVQKIGLIGRQANDGSVRETRDIQETPRDSVYGHHLEKDAPPAYDEVVRK